MDKKALYRVEEFSPSELLDMKILLHGYAEEINGLPKHHSEVFSKRGWMLPFLFAYDKLLWGRWDYWLDIIEKGTIEGSGVIPQIEWETDYQMISEIYKMLEKTMKHPESNIERFSEWMHWALAINHEQQKLTISESLNEHYYKYFDLFLILRYPTDYLSRLLSEETGKGYKGALGYYPTPFHICILMNELTFEKGKDYKKQTVIDPCIGCGAMLLPASNYTLRGYGQDISKIAIDLAKIQMYWYAPWYAFHPENIGGFEEGEPLIIHDQRMESQLMFNL